MQGLTCRSYPAARGSPDGDVKMNRHERSRTGVGQRLLTVGDVARLLAVSPRTVIRLRAAGRLPEPVRLGRSVRWRRDDLEDWIGAGCPCEADDTKVLSC